jgi:hypothetical protein
MEDPRQALPRRLPFCCLRNFTFFGINIAKNLEPSCQSSVVSCQFAIAALGITPLTTKNQQPTFSKFTTAKLTTDNC